MADSNVVLEGVRISFSYLFEPSDLSGKYGSDLIIPKTDAKNLTKIKAATAAATKAGLEKQWGGKAPKEFQYPVLRDGDDRERDPQGAYTDCWYIRAKSKNQPGVFEYKGRKADGKPKLEPITDSTAVYPGCYCHVAINLYPYNHPSGGKGIAVALNYLVFYKDGEPLGGRGSAEDVFSDIDFDEDGDYLFDAELA